VTSRSSREEEDPSGSLMSTRHSCCSSKHERLDLTSCRRGTLAQKLPTARSMLQRHAEPDVLSPALVQFARDAALSHQLAELADEQGDLEGAQHFRERAAEAEHRLTRLAGQLAD
jgi:hypothetical protein